MEPEYFCESCKHWFKADDYDINEGMCFDCLEQQSEEKEEDKNKNKAKEVPEDVLRKILE